jgi:hypothetical protein
VFPILIGDEEKIPLLQKVQKRKNTQSLCWLYLKKEIQ